VIIVANTPTRYTHSAAFVTNSARLASPKPFKASRDLDFQFNALFQYVIKDRALRNYYQSRRQQVATEEHHDDCCTSCAGGHGKCASHALAPDFFRGFASFIND
jgi:hypothetical protein